MRCWPVLAGIRAALDRSPSVAVMIRRRWLWSMVSPLRGGVVQREILAVVVRGECGVVRPGGAGGCA